MKTYSPKLVDIDKTRKWYVIDADNQTLGKLATKIAVILRGKNKPTFSPHIDCGDYVIVINAANIKLSGQKLDQKEYIRHSGYPGGLKRVTARNMLAKKPENMIHQAVEGMIPRNRLRTHVMSKLHIYAGAEHDQTAQKPEKLEV